MFCAAQIPFTITYPNPHLNRNRQGGQDLPTGGPHITFWVAFAGS
jgi:hypothetical protein